MKVTALTIFPQLLELFFSTSLIGKAAERGTISCAAVNIRDFAEPPHYKVDDTPYGGGAGMVMTPQPLLGAISHARNAAPNSRTILLSASGSRFTQASARRLSGAESLVLVCGRYEGVDQRLIDEAIDEEISIGDYVLMGGEAAAMVVIEAVVRLIPGVIGNADSPVNESFSPTMCGLLEAPHYTRPPEWRGRNVPSVLLSGNHAEIEQWRREESERLTRSRRPDLLKKD